MADEPQTEVHQVPLVWVGIEDQPVAFANQVAIQVVEREEFVIVFGQVTPPLLVGTAEEKRQQAEKIDFVEVRPVARLSMTRKRVGELLDLLQKSLPAYDETVGKQEEPTS